MNHRKLIAGALLTSGVGVGMIGTSPATAVASCPTGSTQVFGNVCQVVLTESGTFTVPSGVSKLTAVLVGGGGGGLYNYGSFVAGGGAGQVLYTDAIPTAAGALTVTVGGGGEGLYATSVDSTDIAADAGSSTELSKGGFTLTAAGGQGGFRSCGDGCTAAGGTSGANFEGYGDSLPDGNFGGALFGGGGARLAADDDLGGQGYSTFSAITGVDPLLWPETDESDEIIPSGLGWGGVGGSTSDPSSAYGFGGAAVQSIYGEAGNGYAGVAVIRFEAVEPTLPSTGANLSTPLVAAGGITMIGAVAVLAQRLITRRRARQSDAAA
ncbi:MAG: LPXTG cell wall anchor domain-containing protein [Microbacteriaceae bacterium]